MSIGKPATSPAIKPAPTTPSLIVGAGLAGCLLARHLEERGQPFTLVGNPARPSAADVAAGIINPVTGRWMTKSWRIAEFGPEARDFYRSLEALSSHPLYHPIGLTRFCLNADDAKRARRRAGNPRYADVLRGLQPPGAAGPGYRDAHGSLRMDDAAWVDLPAVLDVLRRRYRAAGRFLERDFEHRELQPAESGWHYAGQHYARVVFCEGGALGANPWFSQLPLRLAKGETLLCRSDDHPVPDRILHRGKWLLPYPDGRFRMGATYDPDDASGQPTSAARTELLDAWRGLYHSPGEMIIEAQLAGHRPGTADARPLLGAHPDAHGLFCFNGLGSKGASLAPTLSRELCEFIFDDRPLHPETDLRRFDLAPGSGA